MSKKPEDFFFEIAGEEVKNNDYKPDVMAKAIAASKGNKKITQSLYVKFRVQELTEKQKLKKAQEEIEKIDLKSKTKDSYRCPRCDYHGNFKRFQKANAITIAAFLGISFYAFFASGRYCDSYFKSDPIFTISGFFFWSLLFFALDLKSLRHIIICPKCRKKISCTSEPA